MTDTVIDLPLAIELAKKAVELRGEGFKYSPGPGEQCWYQPRPDIFEADDPRSWSGCLVGVALRFAGCHLDAHGAFSATVLDYFMPSGFKITQAAVQFFGELQFIQDGGGTWGEALASGLEAVEQITAKHGNN